MRFRYFSWTLLLVLCAFAFGSGSQLVAPQLNHEMESWSLVGLLIYFERRYTMEKQQTPCPEQQSKQPCPLDAAE